MKKKLMLLASVMFLAGIAKADDPKLLFNFGKMNVYLPLSNISVVYQYDMVGKRSLVGGETPFLGLWNLQFTAGAVTSVDGAGSPFLGVNLAVPNPVPRTPFMASISEVISALNPGLFGGRNFKENSYIFGLKASMAIF